MPVLHLDDAVYDMKELSTHGGGHQCGDGGKEDIVHLPPLPSGNTVSLASTDLASPAQQSLQRL